jgi:hypothetical protein
MGLSVVSISRSGAPKAASSNLKRVVEAQASTGPECKGKMTWVSGDVFKPEDYRAHLQGAVGAVSCIGAFGCDAFMEKVNGDANILAVSESLKADVKRFVYVSTVENTMPDFFLKGYFNGKRRAEEAVLASYPNGGGVVLRPSFVYGVREVAPKVEIPLNLLGAPMKTLLSMPGASELRKLPGMTALLTPPVSVEDVGAVAAAAAVPADVLNPGADHPCEGVVGADDISRLGSQMAADATADFVRDQLVSLEGAMAAVGENDAAHAAHADRATTPASTPSS